MKNKTIIVALSIIVAMLLSLVAFATGDATLGLTIAGTSALAMAVPIGTVITPDAGGPEFEDGVDIPDTSRKVSKIRPSEVFMDTFLREIGDGEKAEALKIEFFQSTSRINQFMTTAAVTAQTGAGGSVTVTVDSAQNILVDDVFTIPTVTGTNSKPLVLQVVSINYSSNTLTIIAVNGAPGTTKYNTLVPAIANSSVCYIIGNAKAELDAKTTPYQLMPFEDYNYVQTQMTQVSESIYQEMSKKKVDYGMVEFKDDAIFDFRMKANMTALLGARGVVMDTANLDGNGNKLKYFMGGLIEYAGKSYQYVIDSNDDSTGMSQKRFIDLGKSIFTDINGSESRVLLVGSGLMAQLLAIPVIYKQVEAKQTEIIFGTIFNVIETGFGRLYLKMDKGLNLTGHEYDGFFIDTTKIRNRPFLNMNWRELETLKTGTSRSNNWVLEEARSLEVRNAMCHAYIKGVAV
ncbi:hypothetical protein FACS1894153_4180 [Bacteroidia bacterium]|nr:hypothetical protein FACS1894153_4180 [Bacteroidia bacterium]